MADELFATWEITHGVHTRDGKSKVLVNGQDITKNLRGLRLDLDAGDISLLTLDLSGSGTISGQGIVTVNPAEEAKACVGNTHYLPPGGARCACWQMVPAKTKDDPQVPE